MTASWYKFSFLFPAPYKNAFKFYAINKVNLKEEKTIKKYTKYERLINNQKHQQTKAEKIKDDCFSEKNSKIMKA